MHVYLAQLAEVQPWGVDILCADLKKKFFSGQGSQENEFALAEVYQGTYWAWALCVKEGTVVKSATGLWLDTSKLFINAF